MSSDKKSDDFVVRIPGDRSDSFQEEKDPFLARTPSHRASAPGLFDQFAKVQNNPSVSIMAYCLSSISMTVVNKYCVSGKNWNLNLFYLAVQVRKLNIPSQRQQDEATCTELTLDIVHCLHRRHYGLQEARDDHEPRPVR